MAEDKRSIVSFDSKISAGHIINIVAMFIAALVYFQRIEIKMNDIAHDSEIGDLRLQVQVDETAKILGVIIKDQNIGGG